MFAIGDKKWPGISKLIEESGEVMQIAGKLLGTRGEDVHWNVPSLKAELENELADLLTAAAFVITHNKLDMDIICSRIRVKSKMFDEWQRKRARPPKHKKDNRPKVSRLAVKK